MRHKARIRERFDRQSDDISLGGVQVAAAGVNPKGPGGEAGGFPGGESEGVVEELRNGGLREGFGRREREENGVIQRSLSSINGGRGRGLIGCGEVQEMEERRREETAKWVGLVGPVQAVGTSGVFGEGVLGLVVVMEDLRQVLIVVF